MRVYTELFTGSSAKLGFIDADLMLDRNY